MKNLNALSFSERKQKIRDELNKYKIMVENELKNGSRLNEHHNANAKSILDQSEAYDNQIRSSPSKSDAYAYDLMKQIYDHKERKRRLKEEEEIYNSKYYPGWGMINESGDNQSTNIHLNPNFRNSTYKKQSGIPMSGINGTVNTNEKYPHGINHRKFGHLENTDDDFDLNQHGSLQSQAMKQSKVNVDNHIKRHLQYSNQDSDNYNEDYSNDTEKINELPSIATKFIPKHHTHKTKSENTSIDSKDKILKHLQENQRLIRSIQNEIDILSDKLKICEKQQRMLLEELHHDHEENVYEEIESPSTKHKIHSLKGPRNLHAQNTGISREKKSTTHNHEKGSHNQQSQIKENLKSKEQIDDQDLSNLSTHKSNRVVHFLSPHNLKQQSQPINVSTTTAEETPNQNYEYDSEEEMGYEEDNSYENDGDDESHSVVDENDVEPLPVEAQYFIFVAEKPQNISTPQHLQRPIASTSAETSKTTSGDQNTSVEYDDGNENDESSSDNGNDVGHVNEKSYAALLALKRAAALNISSEDEDEEELNSGEKSIKSSAHEKTSPVRVIGKKSPGSSQRNTVTASNEEILQAKKDLLAPQSPEKNNPNEGGKSISLKKSPSLISSGSFLLVESEQKDIGDIFAKGGTIDI